MKTKTLKVKAEVAAEMERLCREPADDVEKDRAIFDEEVVFDDGIRMAIQVISTPNPRQESCWTQGVLFSQQGCELGCTEVGESLLGEYHVDDYCVIVETEK